MPLDQTLNELAGRYNIKSFIDNDPIQFPRKFSDQRDIEISAFLTSTISWGRRAMILRNATRLHDIMEWQPLYFVLNGDFETISDANIHRTFFGRHLRYTLRGLRSIYAKYDSLESFAATIGAQNTDTPAWHIAEALNKIFITADATARNPLGNEPTRCLPADLSASALKRFNMALRWLVRNDGIVDIGVWQLIKPSQLFIPLDVHSGNTARALSLLTRKANDRKAVNELTTALRTFNPADPTIYDFALFGAGEEGVDIKSIANL